MSDDRSKQSGVDTAKGEGNHGWADDIDSVMDHDEKTGGAGHKAYDASYAPAPKPGREISEEERDGVPPTDTEARSPLGGGESITRRGEDIAKSGSQPGHHDAGTKDPSKRPMGTSSAERSTGVDPQDPIDPESPNIPPA